MLISWKLVFGEGNLRVKWLDVSFEIFANDPEEDNDDYTAHLCQQKLSKCGLEMRYLFDKTAHDKQFFTAREKIVV